MPEEKRSVLSRTSYGTLELQERFALHTFFWRTHHQASKQKFDINELFQHRKSLLANLEFYSKRVASINPASFRFLNGAQRSSLTQELLFSFYLLSAQYQLDEAESRRHNLKSLREQIKKCAELLDLLRISAEPETPAKGLTMAINASEKPAKYLGLTVIAPLLAKTIMKFVDGIPEGEEPKAPGITHMIREWMNEVNGLRLYWVWGGGLLNTVLSTLPEDFTNLEQARYGMTLPAPITGYMSWILYYARFGLNLSLLLKHTIPGPWMSVDEAKIDYRDRFKTQWEQRKFALLNDSIWGMANMACFFWLTGSGIFGYYGNVATAALLVMDVCLTTWRFYEESTAYNAKMETYEKDTNTLRLKIDDEKISEEARAILKHQLDSLIKAQDQCKFDWRYKKYGLINDLTYTIALLVAFSIMCCFLFPPAAMAPAAVMMLGLVGAAMCFVFTIVTTAVTGGLEVAKSNESRRMAKQECQSILEQFLITDDEDIKKQLYLEMKQLLANSDYQRQLAQFQKAKLIRSIFIEAVVPALVFVSFVFMPLGIGAAVLGAAFALAVITHLILKKFEPPAVKLPVFDEAQYQRFANLDKPTLEDLEEGKKSKSSKHPRLFTGKSESPRSDVSSEGLDDMTPETR
jgi:hypothetical protein